MVSQFGSLGYTIIERTADLTVVQKTIIDTLHKEGKPQTFIAKEAGCSQSAVSKYVNRKLSGRKKCERKRFTTNRENRSLEKLPLLNHRQRQRRFTWAKEKKKWTVAQWSKVLFSDESKFCISFGNQGPRVWRKGGEAHSPSCLKSSAVEASAVVRTDENQRELWVKMPAVSTDVDAIIGKLFEMNNSNMVLETI
ncbi:Transposable element Tc1 transposase [Labeo rohita]|uniref:Transposable element Tc1 transposase n=1 Tax=Labeo rohita TaxID=84645 RepID=A0ABQ8LVA3_LABRO|nr:Transposable element Tc1 transposase [Labeo rohita]